MYPSEETKVIVVPDEQEAEQVQATLGQSVPMRRVSNGIQMTVPADFAWHEDLIPITTNQGAMGQRYSQMQRGLQGSRIKEAIGPSFSEMLSKRPREGRKPLSLGTIFGAGMGTG